MTSRKATHARPASCATAGLRLRWPLRASPNAVMALLALGMGLGTSCQTPMSETEGGSEGRDTSETGGGPAAPGASELFQADLDISLRATYADLAILPGAPTRVAKYQPTVISGDPASVVTLPESYLGPIIRIRSGQRLRVRLMNELSDPTIIHWHGLHVPPEMDAHPRFAVDPGKEYVYEFEVLDRAGTYWFHPHPEPLTGRQVYQGLAGILLVSDEEEEAAGLPSGELDVPLVIQDRSLDAQNQLVYINGGMMMGQTGMDMTGMPGMETHESMDSSMGMPGMGAHSSMHGSRGMPGMGMHGSMHDSMTQMRMAGGMMSDGFLGDQILVNGRQDFVLSVGRRVYRLRLLNGSNARVYKLAWGDGMPMTVIATDGGLLESSVLREYLTLAPGERVELWADFSDRPVGTELVLKSLGFSGFDIGMMPMGGSALPHGSEFDVLRVRVDPSDQETRSLPARLSTATRLRVEDTVNGSAPRTIVASFNGSWLLNGAPFEMDAAADNERVRLNTTETWELVNAPGMMEMGHPIHIHGLQFQVVERTVDPTRVAGWESVRHGYVDEGWKDTFLLMPGERVKVIMAFKDFTGLFPYHCHNLEHEDQGMMRNYLVEP